MLATVPAQRSPFLTHVVPLAYANDLTMQSVLALSGAHLTFIRDFDDQIQYATWTHYVAAVRGLREELDIFVPGDDSKALQLLLAAILLCHYEVREGLTHQFSASQNEADHFW